MEKIPKTVDFGDFVFHNSRIHGAPFASSMGLSFSNRKYANIYGAEPKVRKWQTRFNQLKLSEKEVGQLYEVYEHLVPPDALRQAVTLKALITLCKLDGKPLATRMLAAFVKGQPFVGFVFALWHVCTTDERDLADYVFGLYHVHKNDGTISADNAQTMMLELYGDAFKEGNRRRGEIMLQLYGHTSEAKPLTRKEFKSFCRRQSATLFMAFNVQKKIAEAVVGKPFWEVQSRKRARIPDNEMVQVAKLRGDILSGRLLGDDEDATGDGGDDDEHDNDDDDDDGSRGGGGGGDDSAAAKSRAAAAAALAAAAASKLAVVKVKSQKIIPVAETAGVLTKAAAAATSSSGGGAAGSTKTKPKSRASFDVSGPRKSGANGNDDPTASPQGFRKRSPSLESAPTQEKVTYLTEVRGVTSESVMKMAKKALAETKDEKKGPRKKLVESNKLDKHALKAVLKATMHVDEDEDDDGKKPVEAAGDVAALLQSGAKGGGATAAADDQAKDKGGLLAMFSRVEKKGKAQKKKKMPAEPPPTSILLTDEKKKRRPSDKRVVFDIPEGEDEDFGYDIEDSGD